MDLREAVTAAVEHPDFLREYDRLRGTNLCGKGSPMDLMIDDASGRTGGEALEFMAFFVENVWDRAGE